MKVPNWLFVMTRMEQAFTTGRCTRRNHKGQAYKSIDGWVINHFWVDPNTCGTNGRNRLSEVRQDYPDYFEKITNNEFIERYKPHGFYSKAPEELNRIKPSKRKEWRIVISQAVSDWEKKHGEITW